MGANLPYHFSPFDDRLDASKVTVSRECCITFPVSLIPYILGAIDDLSFPDVWRGSDDDVIFARKVFSTLIAELGAVIETCSQSNSPSVVQWSTGGCSDMANNCSPCLPLRINGGVLQMFNCGVWEDVGAVGAGGMSDQNDDYPPEDVWEAEPIEGVEPDFACVKASSVVRLLCEVLSNSEELWNDLKYMSKMESRVGYDLKDQYLVLIGAEWLKVKLIDEATLGLFTDEIEQWVSTEHQQLLVCELARLMDNDTGRYTEDDWIATKRYIFSADKAIMATYIVNHALMAIGKANFDREFIAMANSTFDCSCPEFESIPVSHTWSKVFDFRLGTYGFARNGAQNFCHHEMGVGWVLNQLDGGGANFPAIERQHGTANVTSCELKYFKLYAPEWPPVLSDRHGPYLWLHYGGQDLLSGESYIGQSTIVWTGSQGMVPGQWFKAGGINGWFGGSGNDPYRAVLSKIVIAGDGEDMWSQLNPDGSWG